MIQPSQAQQRRATAFISCSLRREDKPLVDLVERIVKKFGFIPVGTVGKYGGAPKPIWQQMKDNIEAADYIVLAATPRYLQQDISDKQRTGKAMSEMLHTEVGMAVALGRPVLAFVLEGTDVGNFLPQAVQYISLKPADKTDLLAKLPLINNYCRSALAMVQERWLQEDRTSLINFGLYGLAAVGAVTFIKWLRED